MKERTKQMKVWMTIGYGTCEFDTSINKVFTNKSKALDHILNILANDWGRNGIVKNYSAHEIVTKMKEYVLNHPLVTSWYWFEGSKLWYELFNDWNETDYVGSWFSIEETELN